MGIAKAELDASFRGLRRVCKCLLGVPETCVVRGPNLPGHEASHLGSWGDCRLEKQVGCSADGDRRMDV
eukprot:764418-Hanusia_phi.AAC.5